MSKKQKIISDLKTWVCFFVFFYMLLWCVTGCTTLDSSTPATKKDIQELNIKLQDIQAEIAYINDMMESNECEYEEQEV